MRRTVWRWVAVAIAAFVVISLVYLASQPLRSRGLAILQQRKCLGHRLPTGSLVWNLDPAGAAEPPSIVGYFRSNSQLIYFSPQDWQLLLPGGPFSTFQSGYGYPYGTESGTAFLHLMRRPDGKRRIVWIEVWSSFYQDRNHDQIPTQIFLRSWVAEPASWTGISRLLFNPSPQLLTISQHASPVAKVYTGQADPNDESHFTLNYQCDGILRTLDGRLDNQDRAALVPRR